MRQTLNLKNTVGSTTSDYWAVSSRVFSVFLLHRMADTPSAKKQKKLAKKQHMRHSRYDSTALFRFKLEWLCIGAILSCSASYAFIFNNPYPNVDANKNIYYSSFAEQPKTLDPAISYNANELQIIGQIYEPLLQYDYLKRPYTIIRLAAASMPVVKYYSKTGSILDKGGTAEVAYSVYTLRIQPGILYQPHPAFAKDAKGNPEYLNLPKTYLYTHHISKLADFKHTGTRELTAMDYVYQIKRLASPRVNSPIFGMMSEHIKGFKAFNQNLVHTNPPKGFLDLRQYPLEGLRVLDRYTFEITLIDEYPQFLFWLAMPFFAPIPWEVDAFYAQAGMADRNLSLGWYPIGTGPFMLTENNPNSRMVMEKNPNYRTVYFPSTGTADDKNKGYLAHVGERLPLLDKVVLILEKETIPRWNKFLQGYYDLSGLASDSFDQAVAFNSAGAMVLTPQMKEKGMHLQEVSEPAVYYLGFNMQDPIVGGFSERARKLRQAISIAVNYEDYISIFLNGRGESAQGPIPRGIYGFREGAQGINPYIYFWDGHHGKRHAIEVARRLMNEAGYPGGISPVTKRPLMLHYDVPSGAGPDEKSQLNWMMKEFARIGIELDVRATQYNRFQEKMRTGNAQIFTWGWSADYPDPENFLFLLYGPNGKVVHGGENATNYQNPQFDALFLNMKNRPNDAERQRIIDQMLEIIRYDSPWAGGVNTRVPVLRQVWMKPLKPNGVAQNTLKYASIDVPLRKQLTEQWNQVKFWPFLLFIVLSALWFVPFLWVYRRRQQLPANRVPLS